MDDLELGQPHEEIKTVDRDREGTTHGLVTSNPKMLRIMDIARRVAQTDVPILILGESGVGKDVLASYIHRHSDRAYGPFMRVNCAALPDELLESELFGYEQGAFTGAGRSKPGKFELANNGTVFLDEIGEMSPHLQAKLLHVLQDGEFSRLGADLTLERRRQTGDVSSCGHGGHVLSGIRVGVTWAYWEFNYLGTDWVHPLYELPFTGGFPDDFGLAPDTFRDGEIGKIQSIVPGSGPRGVRNSPVLFGDNPTLPRDPDKFDGDIDAQREFRYRNIPSGLADEIFLDVYERRASFEPENRNLERRLFDAYAFEVARVDSDGDGVISAVEGDIDTPSDGFADNTRLFLPATAFNRFAVTREINDGLLAPRFSPSTQAWVLSGTRVPVNPAVPASTGRDGDDR